MEVEENDDNDNDADNDDHDADNVENVYDLMVKLCAVVFK